jgi:uncharacterized Zn finger protein (UPF0148 family)
MFGAAFVVLKGGIKMCEMCKENIEPLFKSNGGKFFCSLRCLNEYMHEKDWKTLEVRVFRQPKEKPKTRLEKLKALTGRITA